MKYSENLHLALPEGDDVLEVSKLSENFEVLDGAIKETQAASGYQIGDTLTTWRTDLGENWLLCNGDIFDADEYPALAAITPGMGTMAELNRKGPLIVGSSTTSDCITSYATDGLTVAITIMYSSDILRGVYYSSDGFQTVTKLTITGLNTSYGYSKIFYTNGHWILVEQNSSTTVKGIYETTDINGAWTYHPFTSMSGFVQHIEYYDGKYWAFGTNSSSMVGNGWCGYFVDLNIAAIPKNITVQNAISSSGHMCFVRTDKFEFFSVQVRDNTFYRSIADTPDGTWVTSPAIEIDPTISNICPSTEVFYSDGLIYGICYFKGASNTTSDNGIYVIDGDTIKYCLFGTKYGLSTSASVRYARGFIVAAVSTYIFVLSVDTLETYVIAISDALDKNVSANHVIPTKNCLISVSSYQIKGNSSSYDINLTKIPLYAVPKISPPQSYTYIKAKEDTPNADQQTDAPAT